MLRRRRTEKCKGMSLLRASLPHDGMGIFKDIGLTCLSGEMYASEYCTVAWCAVVHDLLLCVHEFKF